VKSEAVWRSAAVFGVYATALGSKVLTLSSGRQSVECCVLNRATATSVFMHKCTRPLILQDEHNYLKLSNSITIVSKVMEGT
jgi:hypothetical protein